MKTTMVEHIGERGSLFVNVWEDVPKIEFWTSRGQSYVAEGSKAIEFAEWLAEWVVNPVLNKKRRNNAD